MDIFTDASQRDGHFTGAYIIGLGNRPVGVDLPDCKTSVDAELQTIAVAVREAALFVRFEPMVVHTDLVNIGDIVENSKSEAARELAELLDLFDDLMIVGDAHNFRRELRRCHNRARVQAGIRGTRHPALVDADKPTPAQNFCKCGNTISKRASRCRVCTGAATLRKRLPRFKRVLLGV